VLTLSMLLSQKRLLGASLPPHQPLNSLDERRRRDIQGLGEHQNSCQRRLPDAALQHADKGTINAAGQGKRLLTDGRGATCFAQGVAEGFSGSGLEGIHASMVLRM
jgi:hypothetical protein